MCRALRFLPSFTHNTEQSKCLNDIDEDMARIAIKFGFLFFFFFHFGTVENEFRFFFPLDGVKDFNTKVNYF